jgi:hypothetical protein
MFESIRALDRVRTPCKLQVFSYRFAHPATAALVHWGDFRAIAGWSTRGAELAVNDLLENTQPDQWSRKQISLPDREESTFTTARDSGGQADENSSAVSRLER